MKYILKNFDVCDIMKSKVIDMKIGGLLMTDTYKDKALLFKAFCDENRLRILEILQVGEKCACTLQEQLPIAQSTLSHHMKILVESGVVTARKSGKWMYYGLSAQGIEASIAYLEGFMESIQLYAGVSDAPSCEGTHKEVSL